MKKKLFGILLSLALMLGLMLGVQLTASAAEPHTHTVGEETITFEPWESTDSLPTEGDYFLTENVTVNAPTEVSGKLDLCLNGKTVTYSGESGSVFYIPGNTTLNLYDCSSPSTGTISGGKGTASGSSTLGGSVHVYGGTFNMYGGTITGGQATQGGGVFVHGAFNFNGGLITECSSTYFGGGVFVNSGTFLLDGGKITKCHSVNGSGVFVANSGAFTMESGEISENQGNTYSLGGGVGMNKGSFIMNGGEIKNNTAQHGGGVGISDTENSGGTFTLKGGTISGNTGTDNGGGVYVTGKGVFKMEGGEISGNTSPEKSGDSQYNYGGGGVAVFDGGTFTMSAGKIKTNTAQNGGGIYITKASSGVMNVTVSGGEITDNTANNAGGAIYAIGNAEITISGTTEIARNSAAFGAIWLTHRSGHSAKLHLAGGDIHNNTSAAPSGVVGFGGNSSSTVDLSGAPKIYDNTYGTSEVERNLFVRANTTIPVIGDLGDTASIGITTETAPEVVFTSDLPGKLPAGKTVSDIFTSDNPAYFVSQNSSGEAILALPHIHDGITFQPWLNSDSLPDSGSWYLVEDVTLSRSWHPASDTDLCLNGKTITLDSTSEDQAVIIVGSEKTLNLYDEAENAGTITHAAGEGKKGGRGVRVNVNGTFNMYGGTISGNHAPSGAEEYIKGGGVFVNRNGTFNMHGGAITGNHAPHGGGVYVIGTFNQSGGTISDNSAIGTNGSGGGVYVYINGAFNLSGGTISGNNAAKNGGGVYLGNDGTFSLSGSPTITGNRKNGSGNNVYLESGKTITVTDALTDGASIGVTMKTPGVITTGAAFETEEAAQAVFSSDATGYHVGVTSDKQAQLMHESHSYSYSAEDETITATCVASGGCALPEIGGGKHGVTLTINEPTLKTYGQTGEGISPEATVTDDYSIRGQAAIRYFNTNSTQTDKDGQPLASAPTNAGTYWAEITLGSGDNTATAHVIYTIDKADSTAATVTGADMLFDGDPHSLVTVDASTLVGGTMQYAIGDDATTAPTEGWSDAIPTGTNAGTYYVWYKVKGDENHNDTEPVCVTVSILEWFDVIYDANGGFGAPAAQKKVKDQALTLASGIPEYSYGGAYRVDLDAQGGELSTTTMYAQHKYGNTFLSWNTAADGSGTSYAPGGTYNENKPLTLYAQWGNTESSTASLPLPTPTREGYAFLGWATDPDAESGITGRYTPGKNVTLYAIWAEKQPVVIRFDTDGGSEIKNVYGYAGDPLTPPEAPVKPGFRFIGWEPALPEVFPEAHTTYKALYEADTYGTPDFTLPAFLKVLEEEAFDGAAMRVVYIPDGCAAIRARAFRNCQNLTQIRLPMNCELVDTIFEGCGTIEVFAPAGGSTEAWCKTHEGVIFLPELK